MRHLEQATPRPALAAAAVCVALVAGCGTAEEPRGAPTAAPAPLEESATSVNPAPAVAEEQPEHASPREAAPPEEHAQNAPGEQGESGAEEQGESGADEQAPPCDVRIVSTLDANVYRGVPRTPALEASRQQRSPDELARDRARDHGVRYLSCDYVVELDGRRYLHTYESAPSPFERPDPEECETDETRAAAVERLRRATQDCTDLDRGAYWGVTLEPMP